MNPNREEILIGRVTDGEASPADWSELEKLASADPTVWTRLASAQRRHAELERAVDDALTVAELVEAPDFLADAGERMTVRWRAYSGWAAAAAIALAWAGASSLNLLPAGPGGNVQESGFVPIKLGSDALMDRYLETGRQEGRVLAELPMVMVESRPAINGEGSEIIYLRQVLERVRVDDVYRMGVDDLGRPAPTPVRENVIHNSDPI